MAQVLLQHIDPKHLYLSTLSAHRPDANAARMAAGAARLSMPPVPAQQFIDAVASTVAANADYVPPAGKGSLYLRPLLLGSGPILGLGPAPSYTFTVFGAAVGAYFKVGHQALWFCLWVSVTTFFWLFGFHKPPSVGRNVN